MWPFGKPKRRLEWPTVKLVRARFDAAQTTDENRRHWANADALSAAAAGGLDVRQTLRNRARYEVASNSIARGIVLTLANDLVGIGPRLQMLTLDKLLNRSIEQKFGAWMEEIGLPAKLRTMRLSRAQDGEAFGVMFTNRALRGPVKLDVCLVEADRVSTPSYWRSSLVAGGTDENKSVDGILFDEYGNPREYHVLKHHPGALDSVTAMEEYERIPASAMVHWFRADRPGQRRGLPDIMPALPLFAVLRRYTLATLEAAETAADFSVVMQTSAPAGGDAAEIDPWITMELERNTAMFAPEGWEPKQMKAEQPTAQFAEFRKAIINEIARCLNMPLNIALGDSGDGNYASSQLDHQLYDHAIKVERADLANVVLVPLLIGWLREAILVSDLLPLSARMLGQSIVNTIKHQWFWTRRGHADPLKNAKASIALVQAGLETESEFCAQKGQDWEEQQEQLERERKGRESRGLVEQVKKIQALAGLLTQAAGLEDRVEDLEDAEGE